MAAIGRTALTDRANPATLVGIIAALTLTSIHPMGSKA